MTAEVRRRLRPPSAGADLPELQPVEANYHVLLTVFKRKGLILICALVFAAAAAVAMLMTPVAPSATAKILIKPGRDALPIAGLLTSPVRTGHTPDLLHTEAELFTSRVVLLPVARALRAERREPDVDADLDAEVSALRSQLVVAPIPNTSILQATASADEPEEAERVLRLVVDSYVEQHAIGYSGSTSLVSFLERETERAATVLTEAEDRLEQWKASHHIVAVDDQIASQLAGVAEFEGALKRAEVDLEATRAQVDTLTREIAALPAQSVTSRENTANPLVARLKSDLAAEEATLRDARRNPVTERLRLDTATAEVALREVAAHPLVAKLTADLVTAQLALGDLRQRYRDEDRRVQEKLEQIERLEAEVAAARREATAAASARLRALQQELETAERDAEAGTRQRIAGLQAQLAAAERQGEVFGRETVAPNPLRELLSRDLATARTRLTSLASQRDALREHLRRARSVVVDLQDKRLYFDRVSREIELTKALYVQNTKRLDDARIAAGLQKHQLTDIALIEPPRAKNPSHDLRRLVLVVGLAAAVGLGIGIAAALGIEVVSWSVRTPEDVESYLGAPVLAAIPIIAGVPGPRRALTASRPPLATEPGA